MYAPLMNYQVHMALERLTSLIHVIASLNTLILVNIAMLIILDFILLLMKQTSRVFHRYHLSIYTQLPLTKLSHMSLMS